MAIATFITGLIPLFTKGVESWISSKRTQAERDFELEKIRETAKITASADAAKARAEIARAEADAEVARLKALEALHSKPSGIRWIDASINLVRALFGYSAVLTFGLSTINLWSTGSFLLTQAQYSETFFAILFYFFAERSVKKAFGKE